MDLGSEASSLDDVDTFVSKVLHFEEKGVVYYQKFNNTYLIEFFDRSKLEGIQKLFKSTSVKMCLIDFVKVFLVSIPHNDVQTLYLTMALIDLFRQISTKNKEKEITFYDLTNHLCEIITEKDTYIKIPLKLYPVEKSQNPNLKVIREIDKKAPVIHERITLSLPKINQDKVKTDKTAHPSGPVSQVIYAKQLNRILSVDTLSPSIKLFDSNLGFKGEVTPQQTSKNIKQMAILSFAYSQKQKRIGCIVKDIGMSFWQASDNFVTEKKINKSRGEKIFYFELFQQWVTTQKSFTQFWDIKQQKIKLTLEGIPGSSIYSICQIPMLRVICVAYTGTEAQKQLILYQNFRQINRLQLGYGGCHTLHYNVVTQTLIPMGYRITIPVYTIHPEYFDFTLMTELKGHSSLVTCISDVSNTSLIVTGDDIGYVRVWDLRTFKCIQVVRPARWLSYLLHISDSKLIFTDSRINIINFQKDQGNIIEKQAIYPIYTFYSTQINYIVVATTKQIRYYDPKTGELKQIYQVALEDQITYFNKLDDQSFIAGTEQGKIKIFNLNGDTVDQFRGHSNEISSLKIDPQNKIFVSGSWDSDIHIWRQNFKSKGKQITEEDLKTEPKSHKIVRTIKNNHFGKQVSLLEISLSQNIIVTGSFDRHVYLWDFQFIKLAAQVTLSAQPVCISLVDKYSLLMIGCLDGMIYTFKIIKEEMKVTLMLINYFIKSVDDEFSFEVFSTQVPSSSFSSLEMLEKLSLEQKQNILIPSQLVVDVNQEGFNMYIGYSKGRVSAFSFTSSIMKLEQRSFQNNKNNYTPFRVATEDFHSQYSRQQLTRLNVSECLSGVGKDIQPTWSCQAHKASIQSFNLLQNTKKYLLTCSQDGYFKIISLDHGEIVSSVNINYALPLKWDLKLNSDNRAKQRVLMAFKTIQLVLKKYQSVMNPSESKLTLRKLMISLSSYSNVPRIQQVKPKVFSDQYAPIDINPTYPRIKHIPTLKELEAYKRVYLNGSIMKRDNTEDKIKQFKSVIYEQRDQYQFLSPYYLPRIINKGMNSNLSKDPNIKNILSIFQNREEDQSILLRKNSSPKLKTDFIEHAKNKHYLSENSQNVSLCFSQIMSNLNSRKDHSKKKRNTHKHSK